MESCETCDQLPSAEGNAANVTCNGKCGRSAHASNAIVSGIVLTFGNDRYWFCDHCRKKLSPMARKSAADLGLELPMLPSEVWIEIFRQLDSSQLWRVRLVCHHWRNVVDGSLILRSKLTLKFLKLTFDRDYQPTHLLPASKAYFGFSEITAVGIWWPPVGQNLTEVEFNNCKMNLLDLLEMLKHASKLKCLELIDNAFGDDCSVTEGFHLDNVERLTLDGRNISKLSKVFLGACHNLISLRITWNYYGVKDDVSPSEMAQFVGGLRGTLKELYINCSDEIMEELLKLEPLKLKKLTTSDDPLNLMLLLEFCRKHTLLEYLDVHEVIEIGYWRVERIGFFQALPELQHLSINVAPSYHVDLSFLSCLTKLQSLELYGYQNDSESDYALEFPAGGFPKLTELHLEGFYFPGNKSQRYLAKMQNLHTLSFLNCWFDCWRDLLNALGSRKRLRNLSLEMLNFQDRTNCLPSLSLLEEMPQFAENSVGCVCPRLREFQVNSMWEVTFSDEVRRVICQNIAKGKVEHIN